MPRKLNPYNWYVKIEMGNPKLKKAYPKATDRMRAIAKQWKGLSAEEKLEIQNFVAEEYN